MSDIEQTLCPFVAGKILRYFGSKTTYCHPLGALILSLWVIRLQENLIDLDKIYLDSRTAISSQKTNVPLLPLTTEHTEEKTKSRFPYVQCIPWLISSVFKQGGG